MTCLKQEVSFLRERRFRLADTHLLVHVRVVEEVEPECVQLLQRELRRRHVARAGWLDDLPEN